MENPRVSDAACLAAFAACEKSAVTVVANQTHIIIVDGRKEIARFIMEDAAQASTAFQLAYFRPILEAALNIV